MYLAKFDFLLHNRSEKSMEKSDVLSRQLDHSTRAQNNQDIVLIHSEFFTVCTLEDFVLEGKKHSILTDIYYGNQSGKQEKLVSRLPKNSDGYLQGLCTFLSGQKLMVYFFSMVKYMSYRCYKLLHLMFYRCLPHAKHILDMCLFHLITHNCHTLHLPHVVPVNVSQRPLHISLMCYLCFLHCLLKDVFLFPHCHQIYIAVDTSLCFFALPIDYSFSLTQVFV